MTTPAGVPNLPTGALTVSSLGQKLQDQSVAATRGRAGERVPSIFNNSTGGNITADLTPFGIITRIWAQVNSLIAQADPADINGPEDIPGLLIDFIEGLPVVGQFVQLWEAFTGGYTGDDPILLAIQELFGPIVELVQNVVEILTGAPGALDDLKQWATSLPLIGPIVATLTGDPDAVDFGALGAWARSLLTGTSKIPADNLFGTISSALLGIIPVSHIGPSNPNLLVQSAFEDATTVDATDGWTWDGAENRPGSTPGSAKLDVAGTSGTRQLVANQDIAVLPGDRLAVSAWVKTSATYNGNSTSLVLSLVPFIGTDEQTPITLVTRATSTSWVQMNGSYTVPKVTGSQVTSMRVRMAVTSSATAGSVWWDDISLSKTGNLGQNLVENLIDAWNKIWDGAFGIAGTIGKTWEDIATALANPLGKANTANTNALTAQGSADTSLTKHTNLLTSLRGGYTIDIVNTTSTWTKPTGLSEIFVVCFGGGAAGQSTAFSGGPLGGDPGAVIAVQLDPKDVPATVSCTIGGNTSSTPTTTSFGSLVTTNDAYGGYVATPLGVILTGASPSKGGSGGISSGNGATGATTTVGLAGGTRGTQSPSSNGGNGGAGKTGLVFAGNLCQTGGSGGGGGGGSNYTLGKGGNGGQGGFPGGGGGGGGIGSNGNGTGGNGGLGLILVIYKLATNA